MFVMVLVAAPICRVGYVVVRGAPVRTHAIPCTVHTHLTEEPDFGALTLMPAGGSCQHTVPLSGPLRGDVSAVIEAISSWTAPMSYRWGADVGAAVWLIGGILFVVASMLA